jgi:hypothetical protein
VQGRVFVALNQYVAMEVQGRSPAADFVAGTE